MSQHPRDGLPATLIRVAGAALIVYAALLLAVIQAFLVPTRWWGVQVPISALLAIAANLLLPWLMLKLIRIRGVALLPGVAWFVVILIAASPTAAGDLVVPDMWPGLAMLVCGAATITGVGYVVIAGRGAQGPPNS